MLLDQPFGLLECLSRPICFAGTMSHTGTQEFAFDVTTTIGMAAHQCREFAERAVRLSDGWLAANVELQVSFESKGVGKVDWQFKSPSSFDDRANIIERFTTVLV